jgi:hypothetical protein
MRDRGQYIILREPYGQFPAGTQGRVLEVGGVYALVELAGAPVEVPIRILQED